MHPGCALSHCANTGLPAPHRCGSVRIGAHAPGYTAAASRARHGCPARVRVVSQPAAAPSRADGTDPTRGRGAGGREPALGPGLGRRRQLPERRAAAGADPRVARGGRPDAGPRDAEARELWAAASARRRACTRRSTTEWFAGCWRARARRSSRQTRPRRSAAATGAARAERRQDWGEAPDTLGFVGRARRARAAARLGAGRALSAGGGAGHGRHRQDQPGRQAGPGRGAQFERVYWRSLRNAPPVERVAGRRHRLPVRPAAGAADVESERLAALLQLLRERRCLLVLDNFETLLEPGQREGRYRPGWRLRPAAAGGRRKRAPELPAADQPRGAARAGRAWRRRGAHARAGRPGRRRGAGAAGRQAAGRRRAGWAELVARYGGNGLALKVVGETIRAGVRRRDRSRSWRSRRDRHRLRWHSAPAGRAGRAQLAARAARCCACWRWSASRSASPRCSRDLAPARRPRRSRWRRSRRCGGARWWSAARRRSAAFTLQSVVLEYVTDRLVEAVADEIERGQPLLLVEQPLIKAQAKDYVRQTQERLIGEPILQRLNAQTRRRRNEQRLLALLDGWRGRPPAERATGRATWSTCCGCCGATCAGWTCRGWRFGRPIWRRSRPRTPASPDAHLAETVLAEAFNFPRSVALSADGALLAAGTSTARCGCGGWRTARRCWQLRGTPARSRAWRCRPTAACWRAAARTGRCGCGMRPTVRRSRCYAGTAARCAVLPCQRMAAVS